MITQKKKHYENYVENVIVWSKPSKIKWKRNKMPKICEQQNKKKNEKKECWMFMWVHFTWLRPAFFYLINSINNIACCHKNWQI